MLCCVRAGISLAGAAQCRRSANCSRQSSRSVAERFESLPDLRKAGAIRHRVRCERRQRARLVERADHVTVT
jgi:hypothetical protein